MIPYGRQDIDDADIQAVVNVLRSDFLTQGPAVPEFERAVAKYCGSSYAVAVNSATSALHLACIALDVGPGDRVWTSPVTFVASANCALYCGATIDFVDIDLATRNLSIEALKHKLSEAEKVGMLPKVVIPVHFAGRSCDMGALQALARTYGFRVIEDASHAVGARYQEAPVGACRHSDIAVFSFHPVKIITTGEGGMALTNDPRLARRLEQLRSHGITRNPAEMEGDSPGAWYYEQTMLGFNYRMTEMQAALGLSQLAKLDRFVRRRRELAHRYQAHLSDLPLHLPAEDAAGESSWHLYTIALDRERAPSLSREAVYEALRAEGIGVNVHYMPVYLQPVYMRLGFREGYCPEAERYYQGAVTLPLFPALAESQQDGVCKALRSATRV